MNRYSAVMCVYISAPIEEEDMEDGGSASRKQCIISLSPKTWKVSKQCSDHG